jgi:hypothetical protein
MALEGAEEAGGEEAVGAAVGGVVAVAVEAGAAAQAVVVSGGLEQGAAMLPQAPLGRRRPQRSGR